MRAASEGGDIPINTHANARTRTDELSLIHRVNYARIPSRRVPTREKKAPQSAASHFPVRKAQFKCIAFLALYTKQRRLNSPCACIMASLNVFPIE